MNTQAVGILIWSGVVMIERPDPTKLSHGEEPMCPVRSARSIVHNGRRAIVHEMPYNQVAHYFRLEDEDHCFVSAELKGEHLQLGERASLREWVETSHGSPVIHH